MNEEKTTSGDEESELTEFAKFLRDMGVRSLDALATKIADRQESDAKLSKPMRKIADHWLDMNSNDKDEFVGKVLSTAEALAVAAPAAIAAFAARDEIRKGAKKAAKKTAKAARKAGGAGNKSATGNADAPKKAKKGKKK